MVRGAERPSDPCDATAVAQLEMLEEGSISAVELLEAHLSRIELANPVVNAVVALDPDLARRTAAEVDEQRAAGSSVGPLAGLVTAHKDLADTVDFPTTYGSPLFAGNRPTSDDLLVARMKTAGVVAVGKTNTPEFGVGSHTFNPVFGTTVNPWDTARSAGGSSGGAAAALVTSMVSIADGSDMGGSLRNPAGWNNVVGLRASPGVVPSVSAGPARSTLGVKGAMARTVEDLALLLSVIAAPTQLDPLNRGEVISSSVDVPDRPLRVAFSPTLGGLPFEDDVAGVVEAFVAQIPSLGWHVDTAEPDMSGTDDCFDSLRAYDYANSSLRLLSPSEFDLVKPAVQEEVLRGRLMTAHDVAAASSTLGELWRRTVIFFDDFDLLIAPVTQLSPFPADEEYPTSVAGTHCERYIDWMRSCCRVTVLGAPALSLPAGFTEAGLPVGVQLIAAPHRDVQLLAAAKALEAVNEFWRHRPPGLGIV